MQTSEKVAMEAEIGNAGGCRRRLTIKIPDAEVAREFEQTVGRFSRAVRIPGFRRGKVPPAIVRKRFGREIEEEVRDHLVRHTLRAALDSHKVSPLHNPVVECGAVKEGEPYSFSALFEVLPEVHLDDYKGLPVSLPEPVVTEKDIDQAIDAIRERLARFVSVDPKPVDKGDFVLVDLQGHYEDEKGKDFKHEGVLIEVGSESNLPEFNEALVSMRPSESATVSVSYPSDFEADHLAGRRVRYTLAVKEIKSKQLPAADDELPKDLGKPGGLEELRAEIREDLLGARQRAAEARARESMLRALIEKHPVEVPEVLVEEQINEQLEGIVRGMILRGINPAKTDIDWKEIREKERPLARQRVLGMMILDRLAVQESIEVSEDDLRQRIAREAALRGDQAAAWRKRLEEGGGRQALKNQMVREKCLDFLLKNAKISP